MKTTYVSPKIEFADASNDIVVTSSEVETGRIPFPTAQTYSELNINTDNPDVANYNIQN